MIYIMCGIHAFFNNVATPNGPAVLHHRGPDGYGSHTIENCFMEFNRLAINDTSSAGNQPIYDEKSNTMLICNGEIYNHQDFRKGNEKSESDCEVLIDMIQELGMYETCNRIRGVFAIVISDGKRIQAARDPIGVRPLFYSKGADGIEFASEIKALNSSYKCQIFPPGHFYDSLIDDFICYYPCFWKHSINNLPNTIQNISEKFENAVKIRIQNSDRPIGFLLSGGFDSSIVASVAKEILGPDIKIKTFSIGTKDDSPDVIAARTMADYIQSDHTEVEFNFEEGYNNLKNVIQSLETYDTTTIRASVPMWLLCRHIKEHSNCRVLLSGEGSDELFGGYKYFKNTNNAEAFSRENIRRLRTLHQFDVLRADRCISAHGLEARVPFLDRDFIDCGMTIDQKLKMSDLEKYILRVSFKDKLPNEILWRSKDAFSDAVGYGWVDFMRNKGEELISTDEFENIKTLAMGHNVPTTKEEALYRKIFWNVFGMTDDHLIRDIWRPRWSNVTDPSARKLGI